MIFYKLFPYYLLVIHIKKFSLIVFGSDKNPQFHFGLFYVQFCAFFCFKLLVETATDLFFLSFVSVPMKNIWTAPSRDAELPCDITPPLATDSVKLVLWFKDTTGIPLYSLDSRSGGTLLQATHSALSGDLGERLYFSAAENPKAAKLRIKDVKQSDGGVYRCRVDFFNSPTRNFRVNLTLVGK